MKKAVSLGLLWERSNKRLAALTAKTDAEKTENKRLSLLLREKLDPTHGLKLALRERQVLSGIIQGKTNKEIANDLNVAERTVKFHVSNILAKTKCADRRELLRGCANEADTVPSPAIAVVPIRQAG